jgi:hypothetical protein
MNTAVPLNRKMMLWEDVGELGIPVMVPLPTTD